MNTQTTTLLSSAIVFFRLGMEAQGGEKLAAFIDLLIPELAGLSAERLGHLNKILGEALAAQDRRDYLWAADLMEYELAPFLLTNLNQVTQLND